jgi:hypothetical protein
MGTLAVQRKGPEKPGHPPRRAWQAQEGSSAGAHGIVLSFMVRGRAEQGDHCA